MITPVAFESIDYHTYTIFAIINAIIVPSVYFFYPETAYRSLEEMDMIFQKVKGWKGAFTVVHQARVEPRHYGKNGELLISREDSTEEKNILNNHHSSEGASPGVHGVMTQTTDGTYDEEQQRLPHH
jgi:hypothetical protein